MNIRLSQIPGALEAVRAVDDSRTASFLTTPEIICGIKVLPMTLSHWVVLDGIDSPFLAGRMPKLHDVPMFLWAIHPRFTPGNSWRRRRFIKACGALDFPRVVVACERYCAATFMDSPPSSGGGNSLPYFAFAANIVAQLAHNFHWSEAEIMRIPLKRCFQYLKCIRMYKDPDAPRFNPFDKLIRDGHRNLMRVPPVIKDFGGVN